MVEDGTLPGWIALFMGLYAMAAGFGELTQSGRWARMIWEMYRSRGLQFMTGFVILCVGAAIYLVNPWQPGDWLAVAVTVLAGWMVLEGLMFLAWPEPLLLLARGMMGASSRIWAVISIALGAALFALGLIRI